VITVISIANSPEARGQRPETPPISNLPSPIS
jgi:hypothetical protein